MGAGREADCPIKTHSKPGFVPIKPGTPIFSWQFGLWAGTALSRHRYQNQTLMRNLSDRLLITTLKSFRQFNVVLKHQSSNGFSPSRSPASRRKSKHTRSRSFSLWCVSNQPPARLFTIRFTILADRVMVCGFPGRRRLKASAPTLRKPPGAGEALASGKLGTIAWRNRRDGLSPSPEPPGRRVKTMRLRRQPKPCGSPTKKCV